MDRQKWNGRACAMWRVNEWLEEMNHLIDELDNPKTAEAASVLRRSRDLVIQAVSDRSGYQNTIKAGEMADLFDVSERTVQEWARQGRIPATKIKGEWVADEWKLIDLVFAGVTPTGLPPSEAASGHI